MKWPTSDKIGHKMQECRDHHKTLQHNKKKPSLKRKNRQHRRKQKTLQLKKKKIHPNIRQDQVACPDQHHA
jgi:translation initiation factor IF-3